MEIRALLTILIATMLLSTTVYAQAPRSFASRQCLAILSIQPIAEIRRFFQEYISYLEGQIRPWIEKYQREYPGFNASHVLDSDPLACRMCTLGSSFIVSDLRKIFPEFKWQVNRTDDSYQGFLHDYVYSPDLDLMVDPTYRQFVVQSKPPDYDSLPRIFIGSPTEFRTLMAGKIPDSVLQNYTDKVNPTNAGPYGRKEFWVTGDSSPNRIKFLQRLRNWWRGRS